MKIGIDKLKKYPVWYKNCKRQRKVGAKICQDCPFRKVIERKEERNEKTKEK